jgi:hypothetical protein
MTLQYYPVYYYSDFFIIGLDCLRSNAGLIDLQNSMLEVDGRRVSLKYAGKLGCFRVVAHDKVVMPAQSEMIIRGALDDSAFPDK